MKEESFLTSAIYFFVQVLFLKEFCQFSQTLQPQSRESFYKTLSNLGVLPGEPIILLTSMIVGTDNVEHLCNFFTAGLETTLQSPVKETKAASVDILLFIVDYSPSLVRLCSLLLFPCDDCVGSTWTNAGARVHDAADQLHRRRRPPHEHCDRGNDL